MQRTKETLTLAEKKFITFAKQRFSNISEKEIRGLLSDTKRFINVIQKIKTEPQYKISYKTKTKNKVKTKVRIVTTDLEQFKKTIKLTGKPQSLTAAFRNFERITNGKDNE